VVGALTTLVERMVSQDVARLNAGQAATRLHHRRRELDDVNRYLAAHQRGRESGAFRQTARNQSRGPWTSGP